MSDSSPVIVRPYVRADAPRVVDLINAAATFSGQAPRAVVDGAGNIRLARYVPSMSERVVAVDEHNLPVGYAYLSPKDHYILHETGGAVHPDWWGRGIGTRLVAWATQRSTILAAHAPQGVKVILQSNLFAGEREAIRLFADHGFQPMREWVHMVIELDGPPSPAWLSDQLTLRPMDLDDDWDIVGPAMDVAYADHWGTLAPLPEGSVPADDDVVAADGDAEAQLAVDSSYSNAAGVCFIVLDGDIVAGGILCNAKLVEREDTGRIGSLFVRPAYRRQGIGRALMHAAFRAFWERGIRRIILDTDAQSFTAAPRFYQHLGMRPYRHEWLYEKTVRPGQDLRRLQP